MGYRLSVEMVGEKSPKYYGTKLYGYTNETKLKSYKWLKENRFINEEYEWDYLNENPILMRAEDFKIFAKLYNEDYNNFIIKKEDIQQILNLKKDYFINDKDIQKFLQLEDWKLIVISWY